MQTQSIQAQSMLISFPVARVIICREHTGKNIQQKLTRTIELAGKLTITIYNKRDITFLNVSDPHLFIKLNQELKPILVLR